MALSAEQDKNDLMKLSLKILKKKSKAFKISAEGSKADVVRRIVAKRHTILPTEPDNESNASMNNVESHDEVQREKWRVGSNVEIYSRAANKWFNGEIINIVTDEEGEWLTTKYDKLFVKDISRYSQDIRPTANAFKKTWKVGSKVEIYSKSENKWFKGVIIKIYMDNEDEWLRTKYNKHFVKEITRYSDGIRPFNNSNTSKQISKWICNHCHHENKQQNTKKCNKCGNNNRDISFNKDQAKSDNKKGKIIIEQTQAKPDKHQTQDKQNQLDSLPEEKQLISDASSNLHHVQKLKNQNEMNWRMIANCVEHEMYPKLANVMRKIIDDSKIEPFDLNDKNIDAMISILEKKIGVEESRYLRKLINRAIHQPLKSNKEIKKRKHNFVMKHEKLNKQLLQDIFDVHRQFKFNSYYFDEYKVQQFRTNVINSGHEQYLSNIQIKDRMTLFPSYIINDNLFIIFDYVYEVCGYVEYLRNNINHQNNDFELKLIVIPHAVCSVYDIDVKFDYTIGRIVDYLHIKNIEDYHRSTLKLDGMHVINKKK
eukprot:215037_1